MWFAHVWQNGFLGEYVMKHTYNHRQQKQEVAACSNASEYDERQLYIYAVKVNRTT